METIANTMNNVIPSPHRKLSVARVAMKSISIKNIIIPIIPQPYHRVII
jgi:hypothetical protein